MYFQTVFHMMCMIQLFRTRMFLSLWILDVVYGDSTLLKILILFLRKSFGPVILPHEKNDEDRDLPSADELVSSIFESFDVLEDPAVRKDRIYFPNWRYQATPLSFFLLLAVDVFMALHVIKSFDFALEVGPSGIVKDRLILEAVVGN